MPGTWTDLGEVISSVTGDVFNASKYHRRQCLVWLITKYVPVDPNIIDDSVGLQLTFGSYWDGIYQVGLWPGVNDQASVWSYQQCSAIFSLTIQS